MSRAKVLVAVNHERKAQDSKWGEQNHPDGTGALHWRVASNESRRLTDLEAKSDNLAWLAILREEVYEAFAESDPQRLKEELIQVAAVAVAWVEAIERREETDG